MTPAWIRPRANGDGSKSYQVLYRRGGRGFRIEHAGSFRGWPGGKKEGEPVAALTTAQQDARTRRDLVSGWLAAGLDPRIELAKLQRTLHPRKPDEWTDRWLASLHQVDEKTRRTYRYGIRAALSVIDVTDLALVTVDECETAVGELAAKYAPKTVSTYWSAFAMLLEYAGVDPNPAQHRRIHLPKQRSKPPTPPTGDHFVQIIRRLAAKYVLPSVWIEQTALRVESIETQRWGDVDIRGGRARTTEKRGKTRWVPVPRWLMDALEQTCPVEDRLPERKLFPGVTAAGLRSAMAAACRTAKIPHYHPHDLRHRRASMWHLNGITDAELAARLGHERASFSKDVYVHVMPVDEVPVERLEAILQEALA